MSAFIELAKKRYSVRAYESRPVEEPLLLKILEAGSIAPSACNNQPWVFIVVRKEETKKELLKAYERSWFANAPVILALCCDTTLAWKRADEKYYGDVDIAIATDHITLAAAEAGLGTCWVGNFKAAEARRILKLPETVEPVIFTPLGYPASEPPIKKRKKLDEIVHWEFYGGKE
ncbi:MAG TPA: nitroreductase family protein [Chitinivibrionales bacterium]|nr:nitroreductase family protein [Chitinivibrionales bacterium]